MLNIKKAYQINKLRLMSEVECQTVRQLNFMMVIQLLELEQLMDRLRQLQLQLQELYQETLLQLKQLWIIMEQ